MSYGVIVFKGLKLTASILKVSKIFCLSLSFLNFFLASENLKLIYKYLLKLVIWLRSPGLLCNSYIIFLNLNLGWISFKGLKNTTSTLKISITFFLSFSFLNLFLASNKVKLEKFEIT